MAAEADRYFCFPWLSPLGAQASSERWWLDSELGVRMRE
jgi:hypothetical protein